ncbi:MAG: prephenate dehydrogenase dimerization domain-containing protein [Acidimicrobiales bacterium]
MVDEPVAIEHWLCVAEVALRLGSVVLPVAAVEHDRAVALTSHLPHLVAAGLQAMLDAEPTRLTATLVAGSFSSATRVVRGAGRLLGAEMAWANRRATVARIEQLVDELGRQRALLLAAEPEPIDELFGGDGADATRGEDGPVAATRPELLALGRRGGLVTGIDVASGTVAGLA